MSNILTGKVVSNKMTKTVVVQVERKFRHPFYQKVITRHKKFQADNTLKDIKVGDMVKIEQSRPISKNKHFKVIAKLS